MDVEMSEIRQLIYIVRKERGIRFNLVHFLDGTVDLVRKGEYVFNPDNEDGSAGNGATSLNQVFEYLKDILLEESKQ
jgi:hypothetical protein